MTDALLKALGLYNGASVANKAVGVLNHSTLLPVLSWLIANADRKIDIHITFGDLAAIVAVVYLVVEIARRSQPSRRK